MRSSGGTQTANNSKVGINPNANTGWRTPTRTTSKRIIALISGDWKEGKTHMALGADPIVFHQSLDLGTEGVIDKFPAENVKLAEYQLTVQPGDASEQKVCDAADLVWTQFQRDYFDALETKECRTVVWDTESEVWELLRLARFGVLTPKTGKDRGNVWGPVNAEMLGMIRAAFGTDKNFIMLEKVKDEYANDKKTGRRERKGFGDAPYLAQLVITAYRDGANTFLARIDDCRNNPDLNGMVIPNSWEILKGLVHL